MHEIIIELSPFNKSTFACTCGETFDSEAEVQTHKEAANNTPETRKQNCIARHAHQPQPSEIIYEMRGMVIPSGATVSSPIMISPWMLTSQGSAERSRVTEFYCPNCRCADLVDWGEA